MHPVRAANENLLVAAIGKVVDAAMLKKATNDASNANRFREAGHVGAQHADASHDQINLNARLRSFVESANNLRVGHAVHFGYDARRSPGARVLGLALNQFHCALAQINRRDHQLAILVLARIAREEIEQVRCVLANLLVCCEKP